MINLDSVLKKQTKKKQSHQFVNKGPQSQNYGFSSSYVWMWELVHKVWVLKYWCFQTVVLEKTLECPLDCKEIKPINSTGNQLWIFTGRTDAIGDAPILWPLDEKSWLTGKDLDARKDWRQRRRGWQRKRWLDIITDEQTWFWANSGRQWRTGKPGVLQSTGLKRVKHDLMSEQQSSVKIRWISL